MKIKKQITTVEEVEVELQLPAYFKYGEYGFEVYYTVYDSKKLTYDKLSVFKDGFVYSNGLQSDVGVLLSYTQIEKEEYLSQLIKFNESIQNKINSLKHENQLQN